MSLALGVLDASMTVAWALPDEHDAKYDDLRASAEVQGVVAPALWLTEMSNVLVTAERSSRITAAERLAVCAALAKLSIHFDLPVRDRIWSTVAALALQHGLTAYDATYLELAMRQRLPLLTLDKKLKRTAEASGVMVIDG